MRARDHEYLRQGTVSLLAAIGLLAGQVWGTLVDRHRRAEFIEYLKLVDAQYPAGTKLCVVLDNHSAHILKQARRFLEAVPSRLEFTLTPKHGSWLNIIASSFGKLARTLLRGIGVASKAEWKHRIELVIMEPIY